LPVAELPGKLVILSWRSGEAAKRSEGPPPFDALRR
jgi:hypothetical protein